MNGTAGAVLLLAVLLACSSQRTEPIKDPESFDYPGELRSASSLGANVFWRQTVSANWHGGSQSFDAAVQVLDDAFLVLGLSPTGHVGFLLEYSGGEFRIENNTGQEFSIPARAVIMDIQRALFPWFEEPPPESGSRVIERFGERIEEVYLAGRIRERRFERLDARPPGVMTVLYYWDGVNADEKRLAAPRFVLDNAWFGYALEVRTHEEERLDTPSGDPE